MKKILFVHHGTHAGGAPLSMLYTMQGMQARGYRCVVGCVNPTKELHKLYNDAGFETFDCRWVALFNTWSASEGKRLNPITWYNVWQAVRKWKNTKEQFKQLIKDKEVDIVHLNSVCLSSLAIAMQEINFPFIWHVREHGPSHKGRRYRFIQKALMASAEVIFLSNAEQYSWTLANDHGTVVNNFVDLRKFDYNIDHKSIRKEYQIDDHQKVILYVGGMKKHKGIIGLLRSVGLLKQKGYQDFKVMMPDTYYDIDNPKTRLQKKVTKIIKKYDLKVHLKMMQFDPNIVKLFALCDLLVFPATVPHFARPIVEASAMKKPVIASDLGPLDELVIDGKTGYLVSPSDYDHLAQKIKQILDNPEMAKEMGEQGYKFAVQSFDSEKQMEKIEKVYSRVLG